MGAIIFRRQVLEKQKQRLYGEVLLTAPLSFWVVAFFLVGVLAIAVAYSAVSKFASIEPVRGVISSSSGVAEVRAASGGFLTEFDIQIGGRVSAGAQIGLITTRRAIAGDGTRLAAELERLDSKIDNLNKRLLQARVFSTLQLSGLNQDEVRVVERAERLHRLLSLRQDAAEETRLVYERMAALESREMISEAQLSTERLRVIATEQQVVELENQLAELHADVPKFSRQRTELEVQSGLTTLEIEIEIDSLRAERDVLLSNQSFAVTAPIDGQISSVLARDGHEVSQGGILVRLLPIDYALLAELYVPSRAIGFVKAGFPVRLNIDAFPFEEFGSIKGEIVEITTTVLQPDADALALSVQEPVFRATVALSADHILIEGRAEPLQVGMALTGNIILEERTLLSHIIEPVVSVLRRYQ